MLSRSLASRLDSGSSSSRSFGSPISARPKATRCCWPPESWLGMRFAYWLKCTISKISSTFSLICAFGTFWIFSG